MQFAVCFDASSQPNYLKLGYIYRIVAQEQSMLHVIDLAGNPSWCDRQSFVLVGILINQILDSKIKSSPFF